MTVQEFFDTWNNKGCDFDLYYGFQCADLAEQYNQDVVGAPRLGGNAIDVWTNYPTLFYDKIENTPDNCPQAGDIIIWSQGVGPYGHIAICSTADVNSFTSMDQNWPVGSIAHYQPHSYTNVLGWLRPKKFTVTTPVQNPTSTLNDDEVQLIRNIEGYRNSNPQDGQEKDLLAFGDRLIHRDQNYTNLANQLSICQNTRNQTQTTNTVDSPTTQPKPEVSTEHTIGSEKPNTAFTQPETSKVNEYTTPTVDEQFWALIANLFSKLLQKFKKN